MKEKNLRNPPRYEKLFLPSCTINLCVITSKGTVTEVEAKEAHAPATKLRNKPF